MDRFSRLNPKATLLFFLIAIATTMAIFNPIIAGISLFSSLLYRIKLEGKKAFLWFLKFNLPMILVIAIFNMIFVHNGSTILFEIFDMYFTLESFFYGFVQGMAITAVMLWFSCYSIVISSQMLLSVFGKIAPRAALIFSLVLSFIPRLKKNINEINDSRFLIEDEGRLKKSISNFSALVTLTLEESIELADSMKARGYKKSRATYSKYRFMMKDLLVIVLELLLIFISIAIIIYTDMTFIFDPIITIENFTYIPIVLISFFYFLPLIIDAVEDLRWLYLKRKI